MRVLSFIEDGTTIEGEAQSHVSTIRKVLVLKFLPVDHHILIAEVLVDRTIKNVANDVVVALVCCIIMLIPHEFGNRFVSEHHVEERFERQILKFLSWDTRTAESRLITVWASVQIPKMPCKTAAPLVAAIDCFWLHTRQ